MQNRLIGAHVSTAGGFDLALDRAVEIGANCAQVFSGSPRVWKNNWQDKLDQKSFQTKRKSLNFGPIFTHALYLVNLASDKPESVKKSIDALVNTLEFDSAIEGSGVIIHVGSHQGRGWESSKDQVAKAVAEILSKTPESSTFLLENSAGQKGKVCSDLSEIRWVLDQVKSTRLGWCLDTCHAFQAGYFLGEQTPGQASIDRGSLIDEISELNLWQSLKCVHVNDSKAEFGLGLDRHENIGEGKIKPEDFEYFLNHELVIPVPLVLEVPGIEGNGPDAENISRLKQIAK